VKAALSCTDCSAASGADEPGAAWPSLSSSTDMPRCPGMRSGSTCSRGRGWRAQTAGLARVCLAVTA
jgi:hypothetical protein